MKYKHDKDTFTNRIGEALVELNIPIYILLLVPIYFLILYILHLLHVL